MVNFAASSYNLSPGGRLSLSSGVAVQTADVVGGTTIYYIPYAHQGLGHLGLYLTAQISLALDSNAAHTGYHQSGKIFDIFVDGSTGTPRLVTGPAWTTTNSPGARSAAIDQTTVPGLWTNTATMTTKFDTTASTYSAPAGTLLFVGSFYASANGQCTCQFNPAGAAGGSNTIMGLSNAYNTRRGDVNSIDSTANWTYAVATWRNMDASASNRVSYLDCLAQIDVGGLLFVVTNPGVNGATLIGVGVNNSGTTAPPIYIQNNGGSDVSGEPNGLIVPVTGTTATLGLSFLQAQEQAAAGTITQFGGSTQLLQAFVDF